MRIVPVSLGCGHGGRGFDSPACSSDGGTALPHAFPAHAGSVHAEAGGHTVHDAVEVLTGLNIGGGARLHV